MTTATLPELEEEEPQGFTLSTMQSEVFWDDRRFLVLVAGRGTGKTTSACMRILGMIQRREIPRGARILVIAPDYPQLKDGTLKSFDRWFGNYPGDDCTPPGADLIVHQVNGNMPMRVLEGEIEVMFRSAMNPDQTRAKECTLVWLDEAAQMDEQLLTLTNANLRQFGDSVKYQTIITTTPRGKNWIYRRFGSHLARPDNDDPLVGAYRTTTMEAFREGVVRAGYIEEIGYTPGSEMWRQELEAEFVSWSGLVFRQNWNLIEGRLPIFKYVTGGIDLGTISPTAVELTGITEQGAIYVFGEFYQPNAKLQDVMKVVGERSQEYSVRSWHVDNDILWKMMRNAGFQARPPNKKADAANFSITHVNSLIDRGMLYLHPQCHGLLSEMSTYEYKDKQSGDEVTFLDKVKPNQPDHGIDALRYAIKPLTAWQAQQAYGREVRFSIG